MSQFNLNKNLMQLRYKKGITQEKLADFLGVSKASVSKWETKQSMPDILLLPQLAAFFDVTTVVQLVVAVLVFNRKDV